MRILHLRTSPFLGSPEKLILTQMRNLKDRVENHLGFIPDGHNQDFFRAARSSGIKSFVLESISQLSNLIYEENYDIVVSHDYKANFYAWRAARKSKRIAVFHGRTSHDFKSRTYEWLDSFILRTVDTIVAVSHATKDQISYLDVPIVVIHNAYEIEGLNGSFNVPRTEQKGVVFLTAGRLSVEKAQARLIDAFRQVLQSCPGSQLWIAGEGHERAALENKIEGLDLRDHVHLLGHVKDMPSLYASCDIFVLPSDREGLPLVLLEAGSYGKPVIATDVGGVSELITHQKSGYLISPQSQGALAFAMKDLALNASKRESMGLALKNVIQNDFSPQSYADEYFNLYNQIVDASPIWITWEKHRRTRELARHLNLELIEILSDSPRWRRYPLLIWKTFSVIMSRRPEILFVQSPSVVLAFFAVLVKKFVPMTLVVDAHNEGVKPYAYATWWNRWIVCKIHRMADLVIVTNKALEEIVKNNKGNSFVLPDPIPEISVRTAGPLQNGAKPSNVVFICTFSPDEPYKDVILAAQLLPSGTTLHVTGNYKKVNPDIIRQAPSNVNFLGYVSDEEYAEYLSQADVIVDLTNMENCLVCGAYEAVSLERPLVTSNTEALRKYFYQGTLYSDHAPEKLGSAITQAIQDKDRLQAEMANLKKDLKMSWEKGKEELLKYVRDRRIH